MAKMTKQQLAAIEKKKQAIRDKTLDDLLTKLNKYGKCSLIRPTGFGKTCMLTNLIKSYKKVLYLYPAEVIKNTVVGKYYDPKFNPDAAAFDEETLDTMKELGQIDNVTLMTYSKLIRLKDKDIKNLDFDLIIADECHRLGGKRTMIAFGSLIANFPNAHFVGATATPIRGDTFDVIHTFFDDVTVYPYTLHDAIQDGILQKPVYIFCTADIETDLKEEALMAGEDINDLRVQEVLKKELIEISNLFDMDKVIKRECKKHLKNTKYMKFIVFFTSFDHLHDKDTSVIEWFENAFPKHTVQTTYITSENEKLRKNVNTLDDINAKDNTIDLIFCIDMLNMGYHVDDLTGIVMYRGTHSDIIYIQQLGRALSSNSNTSPIVFDVVDNLHRKALFGITPQELTTKGGAKPIIDTAWEIDLNHPLDPATTTINFTSIRIKNGEFIDKRGQKIELYYSKDRDTGNTGPFLIDNRNNIYNIQGKKINNIWIKDNGVIYTREINNGSNWLNYVNTINREDLIMEGHEATYRELMAKAIGEPTVQRCKEAWEAHFSAWCDMNGYPYPVSELELEKVFGSSKEEFTKYYQNLIATNGWDYPMHDAEKLLQIGKNNGPFTNLMPPLEIFSKWKNVSVNAILDLLGIT